MFSDHLFTRMYQSTTVTNKIVLQAQYCQWNRKISFYFTHRSVGQLVTLSQVFHVLSRLGSKRQGETLLQTMEGKAYESKQNYVRPLMRWLKTGTLSLLSIYHWLNQVTWPRTKSTDIKVHSIHNEARVRSKTTTANNSIYHNGSTANVTYSFFFKCHLFNSDFLDE